MNGRALTTVARAQPPAADKADSRVCYTCGQPGHISARCPTASGDASAPRQARPPRQPRAPRENAPAAQSAPKDASSKRCFICNGPHLQKDCPDAGKQAPAQAGGAGAGAASGRRSRGIKCYNCGESGHISKACPKIELGPKCYQCSQFGHISSECTNAQAQAAEGQQF